MPASGAEGGDGGRVDTGPPLGSWLRLYLLVAALAVLIVALLWALTAAYHVEAPA